MFENARFLRDRSRMNGYPLTNILALIIARTPSPVKPNGRTTGVRRAAILSSAPLASSAHDDHHEMGSSV
jgi:hypothetical protein